ncbi:TetR/AcrR family transcriptional regulator [Actinomadura rudentiformis]|uniref:TetR/AcrR family transcriptional regulator n=1 Tax=Actinomadura rudentiformis TaxID=359158 RepID=A0A6H9YYL1_9ACTN|nr:TetR/AcrR family transcriptional regulator [Actinomadura rudentiformis]KAB2345477.1 TetR/AcrR family transcriptional regulator [Actinomadura rudentiformis]
MTETTQQRPGAGRSPGRPRSERAEKAIIEATLDLLAEESGVAGVSIEAVAARAGVGKTTIYRRWSNKEALIVDALASVKGTLPTPPGDSVREDLLVLALAMHTERHRKHAKCFWNVVGSAEKFPELYARYRQDVIEPRRDVIRAVLRRGIETGELRADLDVDVSLAMLVGSLSIKTPKDELPEGFPEAVVATLLEGIAAPGA